MVWQLLFLRTLYLSQLRGKINAMPSYTGVTEMDKGDDPSLDGPISGRMKILPHIVSRARVY